jgi:hypothetical protein
LNCGFNRLHSFFLSFLPFVFIFFGFSKIAYSLLCFAFSFLFVVSLGV